MILRNRGSSTVSRLREPVRPAAVYRAADLLVLPSDYDPCPVVVSEAMVCGCPAAISNEIRARFDLVRPGRTGFIFLCGNVDALSAILREALSSPCLLRELSRAALERMETWTIRRNVEALESVRRQEIRLGPSIPAVALDARPPPAFGCRFDRRVIWLGTTHLDVGVASRALPNADARDRRGLRLQRSA
jgi:hypothetical protein